MANITTFARRFPDLADRLDHRCVEDDLANVDPVWQLLWRRGLQTQWRNELVALRNLVPLIELYVRERNREHIPYPRCACQRCHDTALAFAESARKERDRSPSRRYKDA
jgi:hypothetical protein